MNAARTEPVDRRTKSSAEPRRQRHRTRGATFVEYAVLVGVLAIGGAGAWWRFGAAIDSGTKVQGKCVDATAGGAACGEELEAAKPSAPATGALLANGGPICDRLGNCTPGTGNCFARGTLVATDTGLRAIESIGVGDQVLARDTGDGETELRPVARTIVTAGKPLVEVALEGEGGPETIATTYEHPFFVEGRGFVSAGLLEAGDVIASAGASSRVVSLFQRAETATVYNLEVTGFHTYFVGRHRSWVHNECAPGEPKETATPMKAVPKAPPSTYKPREITADRLSESSTPSLATFADALEGKGFMAYVPGTSYLRGELLKGVDLEGFRNRPLSMNPTYVPTHPLPEGVKAATAPAAVPDLPAGRRLPFETASDLVAGFRSGDAAKTPTRVAERFLAAVALDRADGDSLNPFHSVIAADVRKQAEASTLRYKQGKPLGPLDGVLVAVKDQVDVAGYVTGAGTKFLNTKAANDAVVIARLRAQGAIIVGKTNMHELGAGVSGVNPHSGVVRNPYDSDHVGGGSSGGSAVAVASGMVPIAVASDAGGSTRVPAALNGMVGLKPTFGRIPSNGAAGNYPLAPSLTQLGPIATNARDAAMMYLAMAGPDPKDPSSMKQPAPHIDGFADTKLQGLRIGVYRGWFEHADPEVRFANEALLKRLVAAGATVKEIELPEVTEAGRAQMLTFASELGRAQAKLKRPSSDYSPEVRVILTLNRDALTGGDYQQAARERTREITAFNRVFNEVDVVLTPATAVAAPKVPTDALRTGDSDLATVEKISRFATAANMTGMPAITFPAGYTKGGLPIGAQLIGRPWEEHTLLRFANAAEQTTERVAPKNSFSILRDDGARPLRKTTAPMGYEEREIRKYANSTTSDRRNTPGPVGENARRLLENDKRDRYAEELRRIGAIGDPREAAILSARGTKFYEDHKAAPGSCGNCHR